MNPAWLLLPVFLFLLAQPSVGAQSNGPHVIKGTIYTAEDRPAGRVEVSLEGTTGVQLVCTFADQSGRYAFPGLGFGVYRVVVTALGQDYGRTWEDVEISGSQNSVIVRTVDLHLKPKTASVRRMRPGTVAAFSQEVPEPAAAEYKKGVEALNKGQNEDGIRFLTRALAIFPDYFLALARLGTEHSQQGKYELAVPLLRRACKINPRSAISHVTLGMSLIELGQPEEAITALAASKALDATSVNANLYLGIAQSEIGEWESAEENLRKACELDSGGRAAIAHLYLASLYDRQGKYQRAVDELEAYLRDVPDAKNSGKIRLAIERLRRKARG